MITGFPFSFSSNNYNSNSTNEGQTKKPRQQFTLGKRTGEPKKVGFLSVQKPKEDVVKQWRAEHPNGKKAECIRDTGLSKPTVYKWWGE